MPRVKGGVVHARKRKRLMKRTKGFPARLRASCIVRLSNSPAAPASTRPCTVSRRSGTSARLWISRLSAACRMRGLRYSQLIPALELAGITLNRKMLSEIAIADPTMFDSIIEAAKKHVPRSTQERSQSRLKL